MAYIISGEIEVVVCVLNQEAIGVIYQLKVALIHYILFRKKTTICEITLFPRSYQPDFQM